MSRRPSGPPALPAHTPAAANDPLALTGDDLSPLVARARAERDAVARARLVATAVHERRADALAAELARDLPASGPRVAGLRAELAAARARDRWPAR